MAAIFVVEVSQVENWSDWEPGHRKVEDYPVREKDAVPLKGHREP
jgi:hypothetical protein